MIKVDTNKPVLVPLEDGSYVEAHLQTLKDKGSVLHGKILISVREQFINKLNKAHEEVKKLITVEEFEIIERLAIETPYTLKQIQEFSIVTGLTGVDLLDKVSLCDRFRQDLDEMIELAKKGLI